MKRSSSSAAEPTDALAGCQPRSASSADQPASNRTVAQLTSHIAKESVLLILCYLGAHNLEIWWPCTECNPYWYNWYCGECQMRNKFLHWTPRLHFGFCGMNCGCCRNENEEYGWGAECENLLNLKRTCRGMEDVVKTYDGR